MPVLEALPTRTPSSTGTKRTGTDASDGREAPGVLDCTSTCNEAEIDENRADASWASECR